jgi:hypothetical protein
MSERGLKPRLPAQGVVHRVDTQVNGSEGPRLDRPFHLRQRRLQFAAVQESHSTVERVHTRGIRHRGFGQ